LSVSDPQPHLGFHRVAWATFTSPEAATAALSTIQAAHTNSPIAGGEKKTEAAAEADEAKKEPVEGGESAAAASENDTEMTAQPVATPAEETAAPVSPYSIGAYDLTHPGLLSIRLEPVEVRVRAAPACTSAPSRIRRDLETALQAVEVLEKQLLTTADGEGEGKGQDESSGGQKGSAVIGEKRNAWEKEVEQRKETDSLDELAYEKARDDVVSDLFLSRRCSPLTTMSHFRNGNEGLIGFSCLSRCLPAPPAPPACRTSAPSTSRSPTCGTRSTCASTVAPCANRPSS
jgi:hypothetical protein